jgi:hypothetical protein
MCFNSSLTFPASCIVGYWFLGELVMLLMIFSYPHQKMQYSALRIRYCFFPPFWLKLIFSLQSLQVMYDAFGVRLHAGRQAEVHPETFKYL